MSFLGRLERNIKKLERNIEKKQKQIENLYDKLESKKITGGEFTIKKKHIEGKIRAMDSRMRVLKGGLVREKHHLEEKAEKEGEKKRRGKAYFEWSEKNVGK